MSRVNLTGEEALAHAALAAGVRVVAGYPGSPSSGVVETLAHDAKTAGIHVEWSTNERVAFEVALGASIAGARSMAAMKGVGMNVALDPIMAANLTGVGAGLVILLGDDPGAWASQNEQDTRALAAFAELPMLEPATPQQGYEMIAAAFELSERVSLPVIVRETRRYAGYRGAVTSGSQRARPAVALRDIAADRPSRRWMPSTDNAVALHAGLHRKLEAAQQAFEGSVFNSERGKGTLGVLAAGFADTKARDLLKARGASDPFRWFRLGTLHPLPTSALTRFLRCVSRVLVLEEGEPFVERGLHALANRARLNTEILGRETGHVPREGELLDAHVAAALNRYSPGCMDATGLSAESQAAELRARQKRGKPPTYLTADEGLCQGCPYTPTFDALRDALSERDENAVFLADPGCGVRLRVPPFEMLDVKLSLSSCIGIASGIARVDPARRVIAFPGDSAFFHSGVTDLINAAYNRVRILVLILDNGTTALSGFEPHPGVGRDAMGEPRRIIGIEDLARACQIDFVRTVNPRDRDATLATFREALAWDDLAVVVVRDPCPFIDFFRQNVPSGMSG